MQLTVKTKNRTFHGGIKADLMQLKDHLHYRELLVMKRGAMSGKKHKVPMPLMVNAETVICRRQCDERYAKGRKLSPRNIVDQEFNCEYIASKESVK